MTKLYEILHGSPAHNDFGYNGHCFLLVVDGFHWTLDHYKYCCFTAVDNQNRFQVHDYDEQKWSL